MRYEGSGMSPEPPQRQPSTSSPAALPVVANGPSAIPGTLPGPELGGLAPPRDIGVQSACRSQKRRCCARIARWLRVPEVHPMGARESFFDSGAHHDQQTPQEPSHLCIRGPTWPLLLLRLTHVEVLPRGMGPQSGHWHRIPMYGRAPDSQAEWRTRYARKRGGGPCQM